MYHVIKPCRKYQLREQENEFKKTFDDHDEGWYGAIDITEFERIAIDLREPLSHEELQEIVKDLDKDGSRVVSYDEFIRLVEEDNINLKGLLSHMWLEHFEMKGMISLFSVKHLKTD